MLREEALITFCTDSDSAGDVELRPLLSDGGVQVSVKLPGHGPSMGACNSETVAAYNIWSNVTISQPIWQVRNRPDTPAESVARGQSIYFVQSMMTTVGQLGQLDDTRLGLETEYIRMWRTAGDVECSDVSHGMRSRPEVCGRGR